jgi:hypothetical protein
MQQQLWARDFQGLIHTCFDHCDGLFVKEEEKINVRGLKEEEEKSMKMEEWRRIKRERVCSLFFLGGKLHEMALSCISPRRGAGFLRYAPSYRTVDGRARAL